MFKALHRWLSAPPGVDAAELRRGVNRRSLADAQAPATKFTAFAPRTSIQIYLERRRNHARRFEADAMDLIARFGGEAYYEADQLSKGYGLGEYDRSRLHWARVKVEVARRREINIELSGSVRWD